MEGIAEDAIGSPAPALSGARVARHVEFTVRQRGRKLRLAPWCRASPRATPHELARGGHVIVCGLGAWGSGRSKRCARARGGRGRRRRPDLRLARVVEGWGVEHIARSAHLGDGLSEAGLDRAAAVVCAATDEILALETAFGCASCVPMCASWSRWPTRRSAGRSSGSRGPAACSTSPASPPRRSSRPASGAQPTNSNSAVWTLRWSRPRSHPTPSATTPSGTLRQPGAGGHHARRRCPMAGARP